MTPLQIFVFFAVVIISLHKNAAVSFRQFPSCDCQRNRLKFIPIPADQIFGLIGVAADKNDETGDPAGCGLGCAGATVDGNSCCRGCTCGCNDDVSYDQDCGAKKELGQFKAFEVCGKRYGKKNGNRIIEFDEEGCNIRCYPRSETYMRYDEDGHDCRFSKHEDEEEEDIRTPISCRRGQRLGLKRGFIRRNPRRIIKIYNSPNIDDNDCNDCREKFIAPRPVRLKFRDAESICDEPECDYDRQENSCRGRNILKNEPCVVCVDRYGELLDLPFSGQGIENYRRNLASTRLNGRYMEDCCRPLDEIPSCFLNKGCRVNNVDDCTRPRGKYHSCWNTDDRFPDFAQCDDHKFIKCRRPYEDDYNVFEPNSCCNCDYDRKLVKMVGKEFTPQIEKKFDMCRCGSMGKQAVVREYMKPSDSIRPRVKLEKGCSCHFEDGNLHKNHQRGVKFVDKPAPRRHNVIRQNKHKGNDAVRSGRDNIFVRYIDFGEDQKIKGRDNAGPNNAGKVGNPANQIEDGFFSHVYSDDRYIDSSKPGCSYKVADYEGSNLRGSQIGNAYEVYENVNDQINPNNMMTSFGRRSESKPRVNSSVSKGNSLSAECNKDFITSYSERNNGKNIYGDTTGMYNNKNPETDKYRIPYSNQQSIRQSEEQNNERGISYRNPNIAGALAVISPVQ